MDNLYELEAKSGRVWLSTAKDQVGKSTRIASKEPKSEDPEDCSKMADKLWRHALETLDNFKEKDGGGDISSCLYKFQDDTKILDQHQEKVSSVTTEPKTMYFELIKMLTDFEKKHSNQEAYNQVKDVHKIQGYQDLTNRLLRNINEKLVKDLESLSKKFDRLEQIIGVSSDDDELDGYDGDGQTIVKKIGSFEGALIEHNDRFNNVEGENNRQNEDIVNLFDRLRTKDDVDAEGRSIQEEHTIIQAKALEVLEKRIDTNEEHIELLEKHDMEQDDKIEDLHVAWPNI